MGSPFGPNLVNSMKSVLSKPNKPDVYIPYIDGIICRFDNEIESHHLLSSLNNIHPVLKFTQEK